MLTKLYIYTLVAGGALLAASLPISNNESLSNSSSNSQTDLTNSTDIATFSNQTTANLYQELAQARSNYSSIMNILFENFRNPALYRNITENTDNLMKLMQQTKPDSKSYNFCRMVLTFYLPMVKPIDTSYFDLIKGNISHKIRTFLTNQNSSPYHLNYENREIEVSELEGAPPLKFYPLYSNVSSYGLNYPTLELAQSNFSYIQELFLAHIENPSLVHQVENNTMILMDLLKKAQRNSLEFDFIKILLSMYVDFLQPLGTDLDKERLRIFAKVSKFHRDNNMTYFSVGEPVITLDMLRPEAPRPTPIPISTTTTTAAPPAIFSVIFVNASSGNDIYLLNTTVVANPVTSSRINITLPTQQSGPLINSFHSFGLYELVQSNYTSLRSRYIKDHENITLLQELHDNSRQLMQLIIESRPKSKEQTYLRIILSSYMDLLRILNTDLDYYRLNVGEDIFNFFYHNNIEIYDSLEEAKVELEDLKPKPINNNAFSITLIH